MIGAIKKHKRIVAAVVILILTAVIELVCNLPAIRGGYDNLDLTKYITVEKEGNKGKICDQLFLIAEILYKRIKIIRKLSKRIFLYNKNKGI